MAPVRSFALHRVYIDEAGDRGSKPGSSDHFAVSAIIVRDALDAPLRTEIGALRQRLGRQPQQVLHFRKLTHSQKLHATDSLNASCCAVVVNVIVCKRHLQGSGSPGNAVFITRSDPMYLWALRLTLERVSWYIRDHGGGSSVVTFAHIKRFKVQKLHDYRRALHRSPTTIHWPSFDGHPFRVSDPASIELLQFADTSASAVLDAVEPDDFGAVEERYLRNMRGKLYRYGDSAITSYGLKVVPSSQADPGGSLHRLRQF